jgi:hypothetical protein
LARAIKKTSGFGFPILNHRSLLGGGAISSLHSREDICGLCQQRPNDRATALFLP